MTDAVLFADTKLEVLTMAELKLRECPFCGGEARHYFTSADCRHISYAGGNIWGVRMDHHMVRCYKCGVQTKSYATNKGCFKAWNRRVGAEQ